MFARHPKTGAPIRVIKSEGSVWRDAKTLAYYASIGVPNLRVLAQPGPFNF